MKLPDSGQRKQFDTGCVREIVQGKGRMDLVPLGVLGTWTNDRFLVSVSNYVQDGHLRDLWEAFIEFAEMEFGDYPSAILELSKQFEDGAAKYCEERNWEKGMFVHCYIDSACRHYMKYKRGDKDEPHARAVLWNIICAMWTHVHKPELIDIPGKENINERNVGTGYPESY